jgi:hypothetical protein
MLSLTTGGIGNFVMHNMRISDGDCDPNPAYDPEVCGFSNHYGCRPINGCGTAWAVPYFIVFNIVVQVSNCQLYILSSFSSNDICSADGHDERFRRRRSGRLQ